MWGSPFFAKVDVKLTGAKHPEQILSINANNVGRDQFMVKSIHFDGRDIISTDRFRISYFDLRKGKNLKFEMSK